jgi:hypothetical protein
MSFVYQNIDPPSPSPPDECVPLAFVAGGGTHSPGGEGDGGSIFWKARDIGLPSYSNNLSTIRTETSYKRSIFWSCTQQLTLPPHPSYCICKQKFEHLFKKITSPGITSHISFKFDNLIILKRNWKRESLYCCVSVL